MNYDKREIYEQEIAPMVRELEKACYVHKIPFFFAGATNDTGKSTKYEVVLLTGLQEEIALNKNYIPQLALVVNGMKTVFSPEEDGELSEVQAVLPEDENGTEE